MRVQLITHSYLPERTPPGRRWAAFVEAFRREGWEVDIVAPPADPAHVPGGGDRTDRRPGRRGQWLHPHSGGRAWANAAERYLADPLLRRGPHGERILRTLRLPALGGSRDGRFLGHILHAVAAIPVSLRAERPDVLVITVPALPTVVAGWTLSRLRGVPLIVEMRDAWPDLARESGVSAGLLSRLMEVLVTGTQRAADLVVTVTEGFGQRLAERGIRTVQVVGNGVDLSRIAVVPRRRREPGELNVLYLGNHGESQGLETVVRAAALARRSAARIHVRLVGSGTRRAELDELNMALGSPAELLEPVHGEGVTEQYAWADTCLICLRPDWPSFAWTIPSKTYEILAVDRHISGMVTGEAARLLANTGSADLVAADPAALVALWERLAADPDSTNTHGQGREWVARHADLPRLGDQFVEFLSSQVGSRRSLPRGESPTTTRSAVNRSAAQRPAGMRPPAPQNAPRDVPPTSS